MTDNKPRICQRCLQPYMPVTNVGSWQCRIHPGVYLPEQRALSCCWLEPDRVLTGRLPVPSMMDVRGCTAVDHDFVPSDDEPPFVWVRRWSESRPTVRPESIIPPGLIPPAYVTDEERKRLMIDALTDPFFFVWLARTSDKIGVELREKTPWFLSYLEYASGQTYKHSNDWLRRLPEPPEELVAHPNCMLWAVHLFLAVRRIAQRPFIQHRD